MSYDFIVVGAGSAGAVVASRLSEDPVRSVLLLEAGPDYRSASDTPRDILDSRDLAGMAHDWNYSSVPVPGRTMPYRRGKVIGGTSAINAAAAQWGKPEDFAAWVRAGNDEWGWEAVEPLFRKLECDRDAPGHGTDGPIPICRYSYDDLIPLQRAFFDACRDLGFAEVRDHNAAGAAGVGPWPLNRDGLTRVSTALGYLGPARPRTNLEVRGSTTVGRIRLDGRRAVGVETLDDEFVAGKQVILCAGAIGTPAILLRSGIGPSSHLHELDIDVVADLPVGVRLWDHAAVPVYLRPRPGQCVIGRDPRFQVLATSTAESSSEPHDLQMVMTTHLDVSAVPVLRTAAGVSVVAVLRAALMLPRSHGSVRLTDPDPRIGPRIELNYCADPEDMRRLLHATRVAWDLANTQALKRETDGVFLLSEATIRSDDLLRRYILEHIGTYCHAAGTAPMGPGATAGAVVDQYCRVHGLEKLSVVDASVMPSIPRAVPNLTTIMLAERFAEWSLLSGVSA